MYITVQLNMKFHETLSMFFELKRLENFCRHIRTQRETGRYYSKNVENAFELVKMRKPSKTRYRKFLKDEKKVLPS